MKVLLALGALALVSGLGCSPGRPSPRGARPTLRLLGRWDASGAPDRLVAVNPGSGFEFCCTGCSWTLHFDRAANRPPWPQIAVEFDGTWKSFALDRDAISTPPEWLPADPKEAPRLHRVRVILKSADEHQPRWKLPLAASLTLKAVELHDGKFLAPPRRRKRLLEAIGDSITEGILAVRQGKLEEWTDLADSRATYAFRTAEALGAEARILGFGAQGVTRGGNGGVPPVGLAYPFVYEGVPAQEPPADIVVINHGCNDGGAKSIESGYLNLIRLVRQRNPKATILCVIPFAQVHAKSIEGAVAKAREAWDTRVYLVRTAGWIDPRADTTDGVHPNLQGHQKAAERLTAFIREMPRR